LVWPLVTGHILLLTGGCGLALGSEEFDDRSFELGLGKFHNWLTSLSNTPSEVRICSKDGQRPNIISCMAA
jgi:hypothetical protein